MKVERLDSLMLEFLPIGDTLVLEARTVNILIWLSYVNGSYNGMYGSDNFDNVIFYEYLNKYFMKSDHWLNLKEEK